MRSPIAPWAGLLVAPAAWFAHHQLGSNLDYYDCRRGDPVLYLLLGVAFGALIATAGIVSWSARTPGPDTGEHPDTRRFVGYFNAGLAGMLLLAILLQSLGAMLSPRCFP